MPPIGFPPPPIWPIPGIPPPIPGIPPPCPICCCIIGLPPIWPIPGCPPPIMPPIGFPPPPPIWPIPGCPPPICCCIIGFPCMPCWPMPPGPFFPMFTIFALLNASGSPLRDVAASSPDGSFSSSGPPPSWWSFAYGCLKILPFVFSGGMKWNGFPSICASCDRTLYLAVS